MLDRCPAANKTPLVSMEPIARDIGVGQIWIKDERARMGLGSFKALGAAYVIACDADAGQAQGTTYVTASAGNHGLSVAAGAQAFKAQARIYLSQQVPEPFAERLRGLCAEVVRAGETYEASMMAAQKDAETTGSVLLSDSSWAQYTARPHRLMEGYVVLMEEVAEQMQTAPSHIFLQAGVGGLAGACAASARRTWGDGPHITVVEPDAAPALQASITAGAPVVTEGPVSAMGRLDCKEPSLIALAGLARDADDFVTITEAEGQAGADLIARHGMASTPSGAAGLSGLMACAETKDLGPDSEVLIVLSEGPE